MNANLKDLHPRSGGSMWRLLLRVALISVALPLSTVQAADEESATGGPIAVHITKDSPAADESAGVAITSMHPVSDDPFLLGRPFAKPREVAWLGVSTEEAPEVLTAQMNLDPGVGLVITFVVDGSPAAQAGLERNDLLAAFEDQALVLPAQLRKLVRSRREGDTVRLTYYRNGKEQKTEVSLGKTQPGPWGNAERWREQLHGLENQWRDVNLGEALHGPLQQMQQSLGDLKLNQQEFQEQIRRAYEQARQAANDPEVREHVKRAMEEARHAMEEARGAMSSITVPSLPGAPGHFGIHTPKVTVRSSGNSAQSLVRTDETGTYVVVRNPRLNLTAHDSEGKLLFDGEIETKEQRDGVPPELWQRVEPLLDKWVAPRLPEEPEPLSAPRPDPTPEPSPERGTI